MSGAGANRMVEEDAEDSHDQDGKEAKKDGNPVPDKNLSFQDLIQVDEYAWSELLPSTVASISFYTWVKMLARMYVHSENAAQFIRDCTLALSTCLVLNFPAWVSQPTSVYSIEMVRSISMTICAICACVQNWCSIATRHLFAATTECGAR